jgi:uncharacterized protein (TIGR03435 family)
LGKNLRHAAIVLVLVVGSIPAEQAFFQAPKPQPPTSSESPTFEVASIKPNKSDSNRVNFDLQPGGRFVASNVALQVLIRVAYGDAYAPLPPNRLVWNEAWMGAKGTGYASADRFDIEAKAGRELTREELPAALQKLLADRFKLVVHSETREFPIYHLVLVRADGRLGPKLRPSEVDCSDLIAPAAKNDDGTSKCGFRRLPGRATGRATMAQIAAPLLNGAVDDHRPVEDHTGLKGTFEFDLEWTPTLPVPADAPPAPPVDPDGAPLFTAVKEQLGLKLEPAKGSLDVLVVDRAGHPTEN